MNHLDRTENTFREIEKGGIGIEIIPSNKCQNRCTHCYVAPRYEKNITHRTIINDKIDKIRESFTMSFLDD